MHPFAKEALTLHLARSEGNEHYFVCNLMYHKVLTSSHQHLMAEAPKSQQIMNRQKIEYGQPIEVAITPRQRSLILEHAMVGPEVTGPLRMAVVKGKKLIVKLTLDDLDEIIGYIAAEANHTDDKKLQKELDHLYERLKTTMESYDDGMWQGAF